MSLKSLLNQADIEVTDSQVEKLDEYVRLLMSKNEELNLTSIRDRDEILIKHIVDSLMVTRSVEFKSGMKVMDMGTGGGLPGIPLSIMFPSAQFTLVDSVGKKVEAVEEFASKLSLRNIIAISGRAEALGHDPEHREQYDRVLTRAVAPLRVLLELTLPFVHLNGKMIAYKGPNYLPELSAARNAISSLRSETPQVRQYSLPEDMGERTLVIVLKKFQTPERYPRRVGVPAKRPL